MVKVFLFRLYHLWSILHISGSRGRDRKTKKNKTKNQKKPKKNKTAEVTTYDVQIALNRKVQYISNVCLELKRLNIVQQCPTVRWIKVSFKKRNWALLAVRTCISSQDHTYPWKVVDLYAFHMIWEHLKRFICHKFLYMYMIRITIKKPMKTNVSDLTYWT